MQKPDMPPRPDGISPEEWEWFIDDLKCSLLRIKRKMERAADGMLKLCAVIDMLIAEERVKSARRTRFVIAA